MTKRFPPRFMATPTSFPFYNCQICSGIHSAGKPNACKEKMKEIIMTNLGHVNRTEPQAVTIPSNVLEHDKMLQRVDEWRSERDTLQHALRARRIELQNEIQSIDAALEELTVKPSVSVQYTPAEAPLSLAKEPVKAKAKPQAVPSAKKKSGLRSPLSIRVEKLLVQDSKRLNARPGSEGLTLAEIARALSISKDSPKFKKIQWYLASRKKRGHLKTKGDRLNMKYMVVEKT